MDHMPKHGDSCGVAIPVTPEFLERVDGDPQEHIARMAADTFTQLCSEHGLTPIDQRLTWHGTVTEARLSGKRELTRDLPDDALIYCFKATAA